MGILPIFLILHWFLYYFYLEPLVYYYGLVFKKNVEIQQITEYRLLQNDYLLRKCIISRGKRKTHSKVSKIHVPIPLLLRLFSDRERKNLPTSTLLIVILVHVWGRYSFPRVPSLKICYFLWMFVDITKK